MEIMEIGEPELTTDAAIETVASSVACAPESSAATAPRP